MDLTVDSGRLRTSFEIMTNVIREPIDGKAHILNSFTLGSLTAFSSDSQITVIVLLET